MGAPGERTGSLLSPSLLVTYSLGRDLHAGDSSRVLRGRRSAGIRDQWGGVTPGRRVGRGELGLTSNTCSSSKSSPSPLGRLPLGTEITFSTVPTSARMRRSE